MPDPYACVRAPEHPLATKSGLVRIHRKVLYDHIGAGQHLCHYCGRTLFWVEPSNGNGPKPPDYLIAHHLDRDPRNNSPDNLAPSCIPCNSRATKGGTPNPVLQAILAAPPKRGLIPKKYKRISVPGHPLVDKQGCVAEHRLVLYTKIGPGAHACHWCGKSIKWEDQTLHADHLDGARLHNDADNLVPSCFRCNIHRGRKDRVDDSETFITIGKAKHRAERRTCEHCGKEFLIKCALLRANSNAGQFCSPHCRAIGWREKKHGSMELFVVNKNGTRDRAEERICKECGKPFLFKVAMAKFIPGKFCSKSCSSTASNARRRSSRKDCQSAGRASNGELDLFR